MRYAIIGWGSLLWDLERLAPRVDGVWARGAGPVLPLEFSRVSPKRKGALTVVIDPARGRPCPTHVIAARAPSLEDAAADLAARERAPIGRIGAVCTASGAAAGAHERLVEAVAVWCGEAGFTGAVWTDLPENFEERTGTPFSLERARAYLAELPPPSLAEAVRYIERAPEETDTPLRRALSDDPWWREAAARFGS